MLGLEHPAQPSGSKDHSLGPDGVDLACSDLQRHHTADLSVLDHQGGYEPFLVAAHARLDQLLEHHVQERLPGEIADEEGASPALAAECPSSQVALIVAVEGNAKMLHVNQGAPGGAAHHLDGILVAEEIAPLDRVVGVVLPVIATVSQGGVDPALSCVGVAADGVYLADNRSVGAVGSCRDCCAHTGQPGSDYEDIMLQHVDPIPPVLPQ